MYTVGRLARRHGLSRSTLLYYDRIGLFSPSARAHGEYRRYSAEDDARLERICQYRRAGLSLADIALIMSDTGGAGVRAALEGRLAELSDEMAALRDQQALVAGLLGRPDLLAGRDGLDKATWVALLRDAGFSEPEMERWHARFERTAPQRHETFLRHLRIPDDEIASIRARAAAPHEILNINKESGQFMEIFFKIYEGLDREGPGSRAMTARALGMCAGLPDRPAILEPGCGTGGASLDLAELSGGTVLSVDVYQPFLDRLRQRAEARGLAGRVTPLKGDMAALDCAPESFDLIWCEGAAYIMGVDNALAGWKRFLRPGGFLVFSDAVWLKDPEGTEVPDAMRRFWAEAYPAMRTAEANVRAGEAAGYASLGHFTIDAACWDAFYADVERRLCDVEETLGSDPDGRAIIDVTRREIAFYRENPEAYGYEFHVFRK
jgi:DNA-binding transcriptional MerR regulator/ubiquinone/menaquinone biosynthesis C-methylase UbiE